MIPIIDEGRIKMRVFPYIAGVIALIVMYAIGVSLGYGWGQKAATRAAHVAATIHDRGRTPIVFDQFCDGWPEDPTPLRCARVLWCWTHNRKEVIDWPLAEAIPFLKELEERSW